MATPHFTLHPQPRDHNGARVRFECHECDHVETFTRLRYADVAHVLGSDHYWGECPEVRWQGQETPEHAAHRVQLAERHRAHVPPDHPHRGASHAPQDCRPVVKAGKRK